MTLMQLKQSMGLAKSTTATMVRRMEEKGLITSQTILHWYNPLVWWGYVGPRHTC